VNLTPDTTYDTGRIRTVNNPFSFFSQFIRPTQSPLSFRVLDVDDGALAGTGVRRIICGHLELASERAVKLASLDYLLYSEDVTWFVAC